MNRLRAYRELEQISQEELGDLLGLSPQMISAVEGGRRAFPGDLTALGYSPARLELPDMSEPLHRVKAATTMAAKKRAREQLRLAGEVFRELRDVTPQAPALTLERLPPPESFDEVEERAGEVRALIGQEESGPIRNLTSVVERAGVCLVPIVGMEGIDGLSAWVDGVPVIGLSPHVPGDRFRLTVGHELAHLLVHLRKTDTTETEANRFASALLIPPAEFDAAMPKTPQLRDFVSLKSSWGVSVAALVYRAHELSYIDDRRYRALQIQMAKWQKNEPARFDPVPGQLLNRLVEVNGGVGDVSKKLGVNQNHLRQLCDWRRLRVA